MSLPEPILITAPDELLELVARLKRETRLAVDTESNSLHAYRERVCLIQFSIPGRDFLVDPFALVDLTPLASLFKDPKIEKVFHAAEYDLICLRRDFGFDFNHLFDTMAAARILGWKQVGLGAILAEHFQVELNKKYQRADWARRPLPLEMQDYARLDTHYLLALRDRLQEELEKKGRWTIACEDFQRSRHVNGRGPAEKEQLFWRVSGVLDLEPGPAAVLWEVFLERDRIAQELDRPVFKVMGDKTLLELAAKLPGTVRELKQTAGLSEWLVRRYAANLLQAIRRGLEARPKHSPRRKRPSEAVLARSEALRTWRKETAKKQEVESDIILPKDLLDEIILQNPANRQGLAGILASSPSRLEQFGDDILRVLKAAV